MLTSVERMAVTGFAVDIPGAHDLEALWKSLINIHRDRSDPSRAHQEDRAVPSSAGAVGRALTDAAQHAMELAGGRCASASRKAALFLATSVDASARREAEIAAQSLNLGSVELTGPSGFSAVLRAGVALAQGECDLAVVGALAVPERDPSTASPESPPRPAASPAVCVVLLKRLRDALADRDYVWALIRAIAGSAKAESPAVEPANTYQAELAEVVAHAMSAAEVSFAELSHLEVVGRGYDLQAELATIGDLWRASPPHDAAIGLIGDDADLPQPCAELVGLAKVALCLANEQVPPSIGGPELSEWIDRIPVPFALRSQVDAWERTDQRTRYATLTSAGGGFPAHVVVQEPPHYARRNHAEEPRVVVWSGPSQDAEARVGHAIARYLVSRGEEVFADSVATLQHSRLHSTHRAATVCTSALEAAAVLGNIDSSHVMRSSTSVPVRLVFMFPGHGSTDPARRLGQELPPFADRLQWWIDALDGEQTSTRQHWRRRAGLAPPASGWHENVMDIASLLAVEISTAELWRSAGVTPEALLADGIGVLAAAVFAGALTSDDAVTAVRNGASSPAELAGCLADAFAGAGSWTVPLRHGPDGYEVSPDDLATTEFWRAQLALVRAGAPSPSVPEPSTIQISCLLEEATIGRPVTGSGPPQQHVRSALTGVLESAASVWVHGYDLDWERLGQPALRRRIPVPGPSHPNIRLAAPHERLYPLAASLAHKRAEATPVARSVISTVAEATEGPLVLALPYAGGSGRAFQALRRYLPVGWGLAVVDLPGHGVLMGEDCARAVEPVVDGLAEAVRDLSADRLAVVGYSLGGSFAYELAARLRDRGPGLEALVLCASRGPQTGIGHWPASHLPAGRPFLEAAVDLGVAAPEMLELPELGEAFGTVLQADLNMVESFPHFPRRAPLDIPVSVVGMPGDWIVPEPSLRAWDELFEQPPLHVRVAGGHLALHENEGEFCEAVCSALSELVDRRAGHRPATALPASPGPAAWRSR